METTNPNVKIYIDFYFTLYTSNFANATATEAAAAKALNRMTQKINMPIKNYKSEILEEEGGIYKPLSRPRLKVERTSRTISKRTPGEIWSMMSQRACLQNGN